MWYPEIQDQFIIHDLKLTNGYIVYAAANSFLDGSGNVKYEHYVQLYDELRKSIIKIDKYSFSTDKVGIKPSSAIVDNDGTVWIADENYGAVRYDGIFTQLTPQDRSTITYFRYRFPTELFGLHQGEEILHGAICSSILM